MNPIEEKEKAIWRQQKHLELKKELQENNKLKELLPNPYPNACERFIDDYAKEKVNWIEWVPVMTEWVEKQDLKWITDATSRLAEIQQKKLFDYQCLWRTEKVTHPILKLTKDFDYWEENIFNCPFITPITEEEVDIYIQYLQSFNFENQQDWLERWQDYEEIKEAYNTNNENRNFPEWYDFHNGRTGLSSYLLLPDVRGQKEEFYMELWRDKYIRKKKKPLKKSIEISQLSDIKEKLVTTDAEGNVLDKRPSLDYHKHGWLTWFINTFDDKQKRKCFLNTEANIVMMIIMNL